MLKNKETIDTVNTISKFIIQDNMINVSQKVLNIDQSGMYLKCIVFIYNHHFDHVFKTNKHNLVQNITSQIPMYSIATTDQQVILIKTKFGAYSLIADYQKRFRICIILHIIEGIYSQGT